MTDKEAMKLALFALDIVKIHYTQSRHVNEAIAALKERLAQPEQTEVQQLIALVRAQQITIDKLEMALADPMREVQRLRQEIEQEPICPECKAEVLYECVACSSNNYPPQRTEQEPVAWQFIQNGKWHNGTEFHTHRKNTEAAGIPIRDLYTHPPQRTWVGLTDEEAQWLYDNCRTPSNLIDMVEAKLKEKNT